MRFTLRQLEYFVAAGEERSITAAAARVHGSQPTVSAAVARLERTLGVRLLVRRHAQGVALTPAGRRFLVEARGLLRQAAELERFSSELGESVGGPLDLGCLVTLAQVLLPRLCREFERAHPGASVQPVEAGQDELLDGLRGGRLSLALTYDLQLPEDVAFERLAVLPPVAMLAADHPLAAAGAVGLADLAREPLVLLDLPLSREYFLSLFMAAGLQPAVAHRSPHPEVIRSMVANGYGYTLANARPRVDRALDGSRFAVVPVSGRVRPLPLGLAAPRGGSETRTVDAFRRHCRDRVAGLLAVAAR